MAKTALPLREKTSLASQTWRYLRDPAVSLWRRLAGVFAVVYLVSPVDVVPDVIPIVGWLDDAGVLAAVAWFLVREVRRHAQRHAPPAGAQAVDAGEER